MAILRVNRATPCGWCRKGTLPHVRMPDSSYRFDRNRVRQWIDNRSINTGDRKEE